MHVSLYLNTQNIMYAMRVGLDRKSFFVFCPCVCIVLLLWKDIIKYIFWQLDCGIHPGLEGMDALPYIDLIDPAEIDLLLISQ